MMIQKNNPGEFLFSDAARTVSVKVKTHTFHLITGINGDLRLFNKKIVNHTAGAAFEMCMKIHIDIVAKFPGFNR